MSGPPTFISNRIFRWTSGYEPVHRGMDLLSTILAGARLANHAFAHQTLGRERGYRYFCERSGGFHVIARGACFLRTAAETVRLEKGDIVFVMRGMSHDLVSAPDQKTIDARSAEPLKLEKKASVGARRAAGGVAMISVRYEFPDGENHSFFRELPALLIVRSGEVAPHHPLAQTLVLLSGELAQRAPSALVLERLTDLLLYYALRHWLESNPSRKPGYRSAMRDEKIGAALDFLHRNPHHPWTLDALARSVGMSRAALAARFRSAVGTTPIEYVTRLRLEEARRLLRDRERTLDDVAARVGYSSAFSFSKAFKRVYGVSPRGARIISTARRAADRSTGPSPV